MANSKKEQVRELPQAGGSYTRKKDGKLEKQAAAAPAAGRKTNQEAADNKE